MPATPRPKRQVSDFLQSQPKDTVSLGGRQAAIRERSERPLARAHAYGTHFVRAQCHIYSSSSTSYLL